MELGGLEVVEKHQINAPVDLEAIARDYGVSVYYQPMGADVSGKIVKQWLRGGESGFAIYVNSDHHPNRQRFTLAHEIAHFIMHRSKMGDGVIDNELYRSAGLLDSDERAADGLAAAILLPAPLVRDYAEKHGADPATLAPMFRVSRKAMQIRLERLGILRRSWSRHT